MRTYLGDVSCWMNSRQHFFSLSFSMLTQSPLHHAKAWIIRCQDIR
jgi:hypothetical protein